MAAAVVGGAFLSAALQVLFDRLASGEVVNLFRGRRSCLRFMKSTESSIERIIFDFRFLALFAIGGSLAGSLMCFLNGCVYIVEVYKIYWSSCVKGKMVLRLVKAIERPKWMKIRSLGERKTKVGNVIFMILLVKMFERSKMVTIASGLDLLSYSVCIFLSSASLYILHNLHKSD